MADALPSSLSLTRANGTQSAEGAVSLIPPSHRYRQNYRVTRIKLPPIDITEESARAVFQEILKGSQAIVLGRHLIMCSVIASIDPLPVETAPDPVLDYINQKVFTKE